MYFIKMLITFYIILLPPTFQKNINYYRSDFIPLQISSKMKIEAKTMKYKKKIVLKPTHWSPLLRI